MKVGVLLVKWSIFQVHLGLFDDKIGTYWRWMRGKVDNFLFVLQATRKNYNLLKRRLIIIMCHRKSYTRHLNVLAIFSYHKIRSFIIWSHCYTTFPNENENRLPRRFFNSIQDFPFSTLRTNVYYVTNDLHRLFQNICFLAGS